MELEIKLDQGLKRQETNFESQPKLNSKATLLTLLHSTIHNKTNSTATLKETVPSWFFNDNQTYQETWSLGKDGFDPEIG